MIRGKKEGSNYSTWFIGFDHDASVELPATSAGPRSSSRPDSRPVSRAGSLDTLHHLSSPSASRCSSPRQLTSPTPHAFKRHRGSKDLDKSRASDPIRALPKWDDDRPSKGKVKKVTKDLYKHAFDSARKAEQHKFKAKFEVLVNDLHLTLDTHSSHGLADGFDSTSYGDVMLSFRDRVKDLLIGFSRRLQLAYESFENRDSPEDHSQQVKQNVSRFLEDLLGESLDITSDEAVSDLSSLSDDSASDRHAFEDQIAQAVVSKILENHRRDVHHNLRNGRDVDLSSSLLIPEALCDDDDDVSDNRRSPASDVSLKDTDISKDFEDLKNFVEETQSRSRQFEDYSFGSDAPDGSGGQEDSVGGSRNSARASSTFDTYGADRQFPPLPDFSEFEQIDFNSGEVDPDLVQMNLAVIPEETQQELEEDAADIHWRENWIFKGYPPSAYDGSNKKHTKEGGDNDSPRCMTVPRPEDSWSPRVGNKDVDQLSDFSDNNDDDVSDDDSLFYPRTSEELARISRHKRSSTPPSRGSASLIPSSGADHGDSFLPPHSSQPQTSTLTQNSYNANLDFEDLGVGLEDFVGPIVQPTHKELKLLEDLVPADEDDPKFVVQPESVTIQEGEPVKLSCKVAGSQPIDVFWYREQDEVEELEENEDVELTVEGDRHQATLYNVGRKQAGQYMCIALSDKGKAIKYLTVTVKDNKQELKTPEFLKELKDMEVLEGQSVKFRCKVKGYPQPRINWYKDGNLLKSSKSCRIEKFGNRDYILMIEYATMDDDAEYTVMAKNVAGEVKSTAQLIVEPYGDGQRMPSKSLSQSLTTISSTISSDSESDRPSSVLTDDIPCYSSRKDTGMSQRVESSVSTRDQQGRPLFNKNSADVDGEQHKGESADFTSEEDMTAKNTRKLTSDALGVIRAAEEIIESERHYSEHPSGSTLSHSSAPAPLADEDLTVSIDATNVDMTKSVSSGYGSNSLASSAIDFNDGDMVKSSSSPQDEFALYLPPLDDDRSGSYREEVSINLASNSSNETENVSGVADRVSGIRASSRQRTLEPNTSTSASSVSTDFVMPVPSIQTMSVSSQHGATSTDKARSWLESNHSTDTDGLVLNLGPKDITSSSYNRDYEVPKQTGRDGEGGSERKRWSVTLDPYSPAADVVNRQQVVEKMDEKMSNVARDANMLQTSPQSSRASNCSTASRESLDSGVSSFSPERAARPQPVHMVGQTQEEEVPESRAEYDADSGIELPSVSRLRAMFGTSGQDEDNFKRIHSITARSVSKEQLKKLREATDRDMAVPSRSSIQLQNPSSKPLQQASQASRRLASGTPSFSPVQQQPETRRIGGMNLLEPAQYRELDPNNQPVLIYPEQEEQTACSLTVPIARSKTRDAPRPKSAIINSSHSFAAHSVPPKTRTQSDSEPSDGQASATKPKIRSGCISARAAFWERRIEQGDATDENVDETFPEMVEDCQE